MTYYEIFRFKDEVEPAAAFHVVHEDYHASEIDDVDEALQEWAEEAGYDGPPVKFAAQRTSPEEMMDEVRLAEQKIRDMKQQIENVHETLETAQEAEVEAERDLLDPCPDCGGTVDYEQQKHGLEIGGIHHTVELYACTECGWIDKENSAVG